MLKKAILATTLLYTSALTVVSLIRISNIPDLGFSFSDKIFHFAVYCVLTLLWFGTFYYHFSFKKKQSIVYALLFAVVFGIILEVLQDTLTDYRALDVYDVLANSLGALLASIVLWFKKALHVKNF